VKSHTLVTLFAACGRKGLPQASAGVAEDDKAPITAWSPSMGQINSAQALRDKLMAASAIDRVHALHALERLCTLAQGPALAQELEAFTARGIPYYAPEEPAYRDWVETAVRYWEGMQASGTKAVRPQKAAVAPRRNARKTEHLA
jgi:hypothetical protein